MAIRFRTSAAQFNNYERFYIDFRQQVYPELAGSPTYTLVTSGDNQPGSHNLTGGYASYLLDLTSEITVSVRAKPTFAYTVGSDQPLWSWYVGADNYLTMFYDETDDKMKVKWKDGTNERTLESSAYASDGALQVWAHFCVSLDLTNGTGDFFIDRSSVDSSWSGSIDTKNRRRIRHQPCSSVYRQGGDKL
jgi:hypothetical protein